MPVILLSTWGIFQFFRNFSFLAAVLQQDSKSEAACDINRRNPFFDKKILPFIIYWALLVIVGVLFMHVQVLTRFLSACPPLYWFCASFFDPSHNNCKGARAIETRSPKLVVWMQYLTLFYFLSYSLVGVLLFCNFYPWT